MSLLVWLPLTKDLRNNGISNVTITNSNASLSTTEGKLGGSYYFNGSARIHMTKPAELTTLKNTTVCMWIKSTSTVLAGGGISSDKGNNENTACCTLFGDNWQLNNNTVWKYFSVGPVTNLSLWKHVAITIGDDEGTTYLNGVKVTTFSLSEHGILTDLTDRNFLEIGADFPGGNEYLTGYVSDFRVYNHCLSAKEVKEISQGLCVHYTLKGDGTNANVFPNSATIPNRGNVTNYTFENLTYDGTHVVRMTATGSSYGPWFNAPGVSQANVGETYTWSCYLRASKNVVKYVGHEAGGRINCDVTTEWKKFTHTWTVVTSSYNAFAVYNNWAIGDWVEIKELKIEKGTQATPWCPNVNDTLYAKYGYGDTTEYDVSGMGHDGTKKVGTPTTSAGSPRYLTSTYVDKSSRITVGNALSANQQATEFSTCIWARTDTLNNTAPNIICLGDNGFWRFRIIASSGKGIWYYIRVGSTQCPSTYYTPESLADGNWHHYAITFKEGVVTAYIDGEQIGRTDHSATAKYITCVSTSWKLSSYAVLEEKFIGDLSDFRIYATALSEDEVRALYNNPIGVDKNGVLHCMEVIEV